VRFQRRHGLRRLYDARIERRDLRPQQARFGTAIGGVRDARRERILVGA
jgi:hypothetical protein